MGSLCFILLFPIISRYLPEIKFLEYKARKQKFSALKSGKKESVQQELKALYEEEKQWKISTFVNAAYLPLTIHWSLEKSNFPDLGVGICGLAASIGQLYSSWNKF